MGSCAVYMFVYCESYPIGMPVCRSLFVCIHMYTWIGFLWNLIGASPLCRNELCAFALLLFANVIRARQGHCSLLAPLAQSELLICFSVHMTFVRAQHPRPASQTAAPWRTTLLDNEKTLYGLKQQVLQFTLISVISLISERPSPNSLSTF